MYEYKNQGQGTITMFHNGFGYVIKPNQTIRIDGKIDASMYGITRTKIEEKQQESIKIKRTNKKQTESD